MKKSMKITVESQEQMNKLTALMFSLDISFKIEEEHANEEESKSEKNNCNND